MTNKFTASEVRELVSKYEDQWIPVELTGPAPSEAKRLMNMLNAFADLLEAQEKAVPVMVVSHVSSAEHDLPIGMKLYTHPAPADAEPPSSLQEALCVLENAALHGLVLHGDDIPRLRAIVDKIAQDKPRPDAERLAEALRKIVEWQPPYVISSNGGRSPMQAEFGSNGVRDYFRSIAKEALAARSAQAQPPAASVTDAMVERAQDCLHDKGKDIGYYHMRAALEAALAAQENPNG